VQRRMPDIGMNHQGRSLRLMAFLDRIAGRDCSGRKVDLQSP
jgi:hypothetical protein